MKTCPNCGERLPDGVERCPNCHTEWNNPLEAPVRKGPNRKLLIGGGVLAAVVLIGVVAAFALGGGGRSPEKDFIRIQQELFTDRMLDGLEKGLDVLGSGKFDSDLTLYAWVDEPELNRLLENSALQLKIDLDRDRLILDGRMIFQGSPILSGALTYDKGQVGFCLPEVDERYYVADLSKASSDLTGMDIDLSKLALPEISGKQWRALAQTYLDLVHTAVTRDNVRLEQGQSVEFQLLGGGFTGDVYTFTPAAGDIEEMLVKLAGHLRTDKELRKLVIGLMVPQALEAAFGEEIFDGADPEAELDRALVELADELEAEAASIGQEVEDSGFTWTLAVEGRQARLIRIESYGEALVYERAGSEAGGVEEALFGDEGGLIEPFLRHSYVKDGSVSRGTVTVDAGYGGSMSMKYEIDESRKSPFGTPYGTYSYSYTPLDMAYSIQVADGAQGGTDHIMTIEDCGYLFDAPFDTLALTLNATEKGTAQMPDGPVVDITNYSQDELEALFETLGNKLAISMTMLMFQMMGAYA